MPKSAAESALEASLGRNRNSGPMPPFALPITEVLVVAECWQNEPDAEAIIQRAVAAAAEIVNAGPGEAELAVMLTDDAGIRTLNSNWRGIDKPTNVLSFPALPPTGPSGPTMRRPCWATSLSPMKRREKRPMTNKSRSITISAIWRCMVSCI